MILHSKNGKKAVIFAWEINSKNIFAGEGKYLFLLKISQKLYNLPLRSIATFSYIRKNKFR